MTKRILLVDDDQSVLDALNEAFQYEEFEVKTTQTIDKIFDVLDSYRPDLVMIDYILSGINGGEICHQIKESEKYNHISVILMSAYPRVIESLGDYNCDLFISKPFDLFSLIKSVNDLLVAEKSPG